LAAVPEAQTLNTRGMQANTTANSMSGEEQSELNQSTWTIPTTGALSISTNNAKSALTAMINMRRSVVNNPLAAEYASVVSYNKVNIVTLIGIKLIIFILSGWYK
jgi:hypothetical protein